MPTKNSKSDRLNKKSLPPKSMKCVSPELNTDLIEQPTSTLGLADVIYENVALETEEDIKDGQSNTRIDLTQINSCKSEVYSSNKLISSVSITDGKSVTSMTGNTIYSSTSSTDKFKVISYITSDLDPVQAKENTTKRFDSVSVIMENYDTSKQRHGCLNESKNIKTTSNVEAFKQLTMNTLPRRESGVFLLSDAADVPVAHDAYRTAQSVLQSVSSSSSETSGANSRSASTSSIKNNMLTNSDELWLETVESRLVVATEGKPTLTLAKFKEALHIKQSFFVDRSFQLFDEDGDGEVSLRFLIGKLRSLVHGTQTDKIRFLFNIYNIRGTGNIDKTEIHHVLKSCIEENRLHFTSDDLQALADAFVYGGDRNKDGRISFEDFKEMIERHPAIYEKMAVSTLLSATQTGFDLSPTEFIMPETPIKKQQFCRYISRTYIENNLQKIFLLIIYILINVGLGTVNGWRYWHRNMWLIVARICGLCLDFNCTFVLVLMLRRLITSLRATPLVNILPFDQHIMFHKMCGYFIALQSLVHSVAHIGNAFVVSSEQELSLLEVLFTTKANIGWIYGTAPVTGVALCAVLLVMLILSLPFIRSRGCFEVFYWSHKLYLAMWALLIIHAEDFWKWFIVPGLVFVLEAISRISWVRSAYMGKTYIESVCLLPSEVRSPLLQSPRVRVAVLAVAVVYLRQCHVVTQLVITKPQGFTFKPGDYVYIQIPAIAKYEWHPFTISSAPEQRDTLWLHIRTAGYWTKSLHEYFTHYLFEDLEAGADSTGTYETLKKCNLKRRASSIAWAKQKPLKARRIESNMRKRVVTKRAKVLCHIDGPYGTPSRHIFDSEHAVLVGSGIGITPFASILQSIVNQFKSGCVSCPKCKYTWCHTLPATVMNLKKVDFIWINRDQRHFEWFVSLLSRLEREQEVEGGLGHILDMHMYMTSALPKTDMKGIGLQLALDLIHESERTDLITGLQTRTQTGRPDFDVLFRKIQANAKGHVTVFFCGSPMLGKTLKHSTHKFGFSFRHENF